MKLTLSLLTLMTFIMSCHSPDTTKKPSPADSPAVTPQAATIKPTDSIPQKDTLPIPTPAQWDRRWVYKSTFNNGQLDITAGKHNSINFELYVESGGASGQISGRAKLDGRSATFRHPEVTDHKDTCKLDFTWEGDSVVVSQEQGNCDAGVGVYYSGVYYKNPKLKEKTLIDMDVLTTPEQDKKFHQLVGEDYKAFLTSSQLVFDADDEDSLGAKVHNSGVKGLFTEEENIVMINKHLDIWAAVIMGDSVYYYTTRQDYRHLLPKTIDSWREHFKDKPIIFK